MNLIQTLPNPSPRNTRFVESLLDHGQTGQIEAFYDAGGPRFQATVSANMAELCDGRWPEFGSPRFALSWAAAEQLKLGMAAHLAIINPIDND